MARRIIVEIIGEASSLTRALDKSTKKAQTFSEKLSGVGKAAGIAAGAAGIALLTEALHDSVDIALADEAAHTKLTTAFKNSGINAAAYAKQIDAAKTASRDLGFKNVDVETSLAKLIIPTHNVGKAMDDLRIAEDLARAQHIELGAATKIVTGALAGNQRAVKQLGIVIPPVTSHVNALKKAHEGEKGPIDAAALAHGKYLDKLSTGQRILDTLERKVEGQGQAFSETAKGGMATFSAKINDLEGRIGNALLPALESVVTFINTNWATIGKVLSGAFDAFKVMVEVSTTGLRVFWDLLHGDWSGAVSALTQPFTDGFNLVMQAIQPVIDMISGPLSSALTTIQTLGETVWAAVSGAVSTAGTTIATTAKTVGTAITSSIAGGITAAVTSVTNAVTNLGGAIGNMAGNAWTAVVSLGHALTGRIAGGITAAVNAVTTAVTNFGGAIGNMAGAAWSAVVSLGRALAGKVATGISAAVGAVTDAVIGFGAAIGGLAGRAWGEVKKLGSALGDKIVDGLRTVVDAIQIPGFHLSIPYPTVSISYSSVDTHIPGVGTVSVPTGVDIGIGHASFDIPGFDPIPEFARGGSVPGAAGLPVPIMAHAGEFVMQKKAVDKLGLAFLRSLNKYQTGGLIRPGGGIIPKGSDIDTPANRAAAAATHDWGIDNIAGSYVNEALLGNYGRSAQVKAMERAKTVDGIALGTVTLARAMGREITEMAKLRTIMEGAYPGLEFEEGGTTQVGWERELARLIRSAGPDPYSLAGNDAGLLLHLTDGAVHVGAEGMGSKQGANFQMKSTEPKGRRPSPIMGLAGGGRLMSDGLFYGHRGETVTPAAVAPRGGGPIHITLEVDKRALGQVVMDELGRVERWGGPIKIRK